MANYINNPDYENVVLRKTAPKKGGSTYTKDGLPVARTYQISHATKVENNNGDTSFQPEKFSDEFVKKMIGFRCEKKYNQQQFAMNLNMPHKTIQGIEANTIPYNSVYVQKINNYISRNSGK
jgi:DNA-binding XRE family transcriptional regulator